MIGGEPKRTIEKKENKQESFLFDNYNALFKSGAEITKDFTEGAQQMLENSGDNLRNHAARIYHQFVKNIVGDNGDRDPFLQVAGVSFDKVYLDKHKGRMFGEYQLDDVILPSTMLISGEYLLEPRFMHVVKNKDSLAMTTMEKLPGTDIEAKLNFFDPVTINQKRDWILQFGFIDFSVPFYKKKQGPNIHQGCLAFEPEVIHAIKDTPESQVISQKLQEILTWFNHDLVAHGTFLASFADRDQELLWFGGKKSLNKTFRKEASQLEKGQAFSSAFAGELWSLNFHQSLFQQFVKERPAIMRKLRMHLDSYIRSVERSVDQIKNEDLKNDVKDYLLKAYAFGFFRIINPEEFRHGEFFQEIASQYPHLPDLGVEEDKAREYAFGLEGMVNITEKGERTYIPHSEIYSEFVDTFKNGEVFSKIGRRLKESLKHGRIKLNIDETRTMEKIMSNIPPDYLSRFIKEWVFLGEDNKRRNKIFDLIEKNPQKAVRCLLAPGTTRDNYVSRLYKEVSGFLAPKLRKYEDEMADAA